jgi:hypothetical protein
MSADQRRARVGGALTLLIVSNIAVWLLQLLHRPEMPLMILFVGKSASFRIYLKESTLMFAKQYFPFSSTWVVVTEAVC